jgi:hypothetical protein
LLPPLLIMHLFRWPLAVTGLNKVPSRARQIGIEDHMAKADTNNRQ